MATGCLEKLVAPQSLEGFKIGWILEKPVELETMTGDWSEMVSKIPSNANCFMIL